MQPEETAWSRLSLPRYSDRPQPRALAHTDQWRLALTGLSLDSTRTPTSCPTSAFPFQSIPWDKHSGDAADIVLAARLERDPATTRFLYSLSVMIDITARNRVEAGLRQAQKLEALGRLTGSVAHDFNNLLAVIVGSLDLLAKHLPPDDLRSARLIEAALQGARRGETLTARLLAFARQQELNPQPLNLRRLLASMHPLLTQVLGALILVEEHIPPDLWALRADPNQFEMALLSLAANARDAMPRGGRLSLTARNMAARRGAESGFIEPRPSPAVPDGDYVVMCVGDTGTGMDEAALARATDPFFTTKGTGKGMGLGLSMVHGFALQSGGALRLSSQPDLGTDVEIWLPRSTQPVPDHTATGQTTRAIVPLPGRMRILLVDDDPLVIASSAAMLEELGYDQVCTAALGEEALAVLRQPGGFDLLLTDYMMPGMSGAQLAEQAQVIAPALSVPLASGFTELDGSVGTAWPWLRKPYSLTGLADALARCAPRKPRSIRAARRRQYLNTAARREWCGDERKCPTGPMLQGLRPVAMSVNACCVHVPA
jgi:signal transduction histidine kinase